MPRFAKTGAVKYAEPVKELAMKEIKAFIKPFKFDAVMLGLAEVDGLTGVTFSRVDGYGRGRGSEGPTPFTGEDVRFVHYVRLEILCLDALVEPVLEVIHREAHTGLRGDGKIYVCDVVDAMRISTGQRGEGAV